MRRSLLRGASFLQLVMLHCGLLCVRCIIAAVSPPALDPDACVVHHCRSWCCCNEACCTQGASQLQFVLLRRNLLHTGRMTLAVVSASLEPLDRYHFLENVHIYFSNFHRIR